MKLLYKGIMLMGSVVAGHSAVVLQFDAADIVDNATGTDSWAASINTAGIGDATFEPTGSISSGSYGGATADEAAGISTLNNTIDGSDFTISATFSLNDLTGNHSLFETGGATTGIGLWIADDQLRFTVKNGGTVLVDLAGATLMTGTTYTVSASVDFDGVSLGDNSVGLFLDGTLIDSGSTTFDDLIGVSASTFNSTGNIAVSNGITLTSDPISIAFEQFQVEDSALAIPEPSTALLGLLGLTLLGRRKRK